MKPKLASAAILTIKRPGGMTPRGRKDIAAWLRKQALGILYYGRTYATKGNFTARFNYTEAK